MVVQVVRFRLLPEVSDEEFVAAQRRVSAEFLSRQRGFLGREILQGEDGAWLGLLRWEDAAACDAADVAWDAHTLAEGIVSMVSPVGADVELYEPAISEPAAPPGR